MTKINEANERIKHRYFTYLRRAKGYDDKTIAKIASSLMELERAISFVDFKQFRTT